MRRRTLKTVLHTPRKRRIPMVIALIYVPDNRMSKQFVNDVVSVTVFVTRWHEVPLPPLEGEVVER